MPRSPMRTSWPRPAWLAGALLLSLAGAQAHERESDEALEAPGWSVRAAAALSAMAAREAWPVARRSGVLGSGMTLDEQRGLRLEHATVGAALRLDPTDMTRLQASVDIGRHGDGTTHVETARLDGQRELASGARIGLRAGRMTVPLGSMIDTAGHLDRFAQMPLVRQAVSDGDWIDDGVVLHWQGDVHGPDDATVLERIEVGGWRAQALPGSAESGIAPGLQLRLRRGDWRLEAGAIHLQPRNRGAHAASTRSGHTHAAPDCSRSLIGVTCFDGRSTVASVSLRWQPDASPLGLTLATMAQRERGQLASASGTADYRGLVTGGWIEADWQVRPDWTLALRAERLASDHRLIGPGATGVAADAALTPNQPAWRLAVSAGWTPAPGWQLLAETGTERAEPAAGRRPVWAGLRLIWQGRHTAELPF
ncbi:hypothetical protein X805_34710 [Sphaerotilus natans subsp. natans DSM 6575]|uniref:Uncharacterized protein n=1 Tax=Sphaerotilus natans subsp. natans DSM 6575 TaxID=1286631 RepID=A0A059KHW0_9BURK|nr:hypothetical protein [Sphaerotilus natans]KDB50965.1 hypothetical protein X805_34710 [Sphaerotilus natans subsp. natans DSM 6575]SIR05364.1 hypothetical protein SAMN05421778_106149 [Sphaerotilus natans]